MSSPTARTLAIFRAAGHEIGVVERFNHHTKQRIDYLGFCDLVSVSPTEVFFIQACAGASAAARRDKVAANVSAQRIASSGVGIVAVVSWSKRGARGKRKIWTPRIEVFNGKEWLAWELPKIGTLEHP